MLLVGLVVHIRVAVVVVVLGARVLVERVDLAL